MDIKNKTKEKKLEKKKPEFQCRGCGQNGYDMNNYPLCHRCHDRKYFL